MSMRITNKIMTNNALTNINNNKNLQDKLNNQINTGKKINRPSDDPVIAIRALRLRSGLSDIEQYLDKNVEDADCWIQTTEDTIETAGDILEKMITECEKGTQDSLQTANREAILKQLTAMRDEFYATGDADYAGRQLFSGYRTATPLTFQEDSDTKFLISESASKNSIETLTYVHSARLFDATEGNYSTMYTDPADPTVQRNVNSEDVYEYNLHRIKLSYDNLDTTAKTVAGADIPPIKLKYYQVQPDGSIDSTPTVLDTDDGIEMVSLHSNPDPYELMATYGRKPADPPDPANPDDGKYYDKAIYIYETGELLIGEGLYEKLSKTRDDTATSPTDEGRLDIEYYKSTWSKGDVNPVHYFHCVENVGTLEAINHNRELLSGTVMDNAIEYDVGNNQSIRVNTTADEVFDLGVGRVIDSLTNIINDVSKIESKTQEFELLAVDGADEALTETYEALKKSLDMEKKKLQSAFSEAMTTLKEYYDKTNRAITEAGTRSARVELVKNRLTSQKSNFTDLVKDNEQVDVTQAAIDFASAKLAYDASLMASGKIAQTTLMNYI